jgi:hypothetical protein
VVGVPLQAPTCSRSVAFAGEVSTVETTSFKPLSPDAVLAEALAVTDDQIGQVAAYCVQLTKPQVGNLHGSAQLQRSCKLDALLL